MCCKKHYLCVPFCVILYSVLLKASWTPLKLSRVKAGQHLDERLPGKFRIKAKEVLSRPADAAHLELCVGPNGPEQ